VKEAGYRTLAERTEGKPYWEKPGWAAAVDPRHPVTYMAWDDARAFCDWLGKREGRAYRLPTEAEWEFACRAGTTTRWSWGDDPAECLRHGWFNRPVNSGPGKVGEKVPNAFGLYDTHGNAEEWCEDWHHALASLPPVDPHATERQVVADRAAVGRVVRGGFAFDIPELGRSGRRTYVPPQDTTGIALGFRVALVGDLNAKPTPPAVEVAPPPRPKP
jgi:formylglycine-generating enzyme required for sulfatase activity